ncbi:hypothetical protein BD410DRAFT_901905 [Rickenella mellea]|uniref:Uncharacterized protein n=1 Tax=Rickenella mellea TaxID=50990 RepID=A0A4Y7PMJ5_9AGAM|nr:hypothetical protein BD410DRAFT_901905 [Rickenella mellea]
MSFRSADSQATQFECPPPSSFPDGSYEIITQASRLTSRYVTSLFKIDRQESPSTSQVFEDLNSQRAEIDDLDVQIRVAHMQIEILRLALKNSEKNLSSLILKRDHRLKISKRLTEGTCRVQLPNEILLTIFKFVYDSWQSSHLCVAPLEDLEMSMHMFLRYHTPGEVRAVDVRNRETILIRSAMSEYTTKCFDRLLEENIGLDIVIPTSSSWPDYSPGSGDKLELVLRVSSRWIGLTIQNESDTRTYDMLSRCKDVLPRIKYLSIDCHELSSAGIPLNYPWWTRENATSGSVQLRAATIPYRYIPMSGGLLEHIVDMTLIINKM